MRQALRYTTRTTQYGKEVNITLDRLSNGLTVKNGGNSVLIFDDDPLQPTESKGIGGNRAEILVGRYRLYFEPIASPPPGYVQNDLAIVTEKYYMEGQGLENH